MEEFRRGRHNLSPGAADIRDRFAADFLGTLWERPDVRKRWILRSRNEASVREVADGLAFSVAASLDRILPTNILGPTVRHAILDDFAYMISLRDRRKKRGEKEPDEESWWAVPSSTPSLRSPGGRPGPSPSGPRSTRTPSGADAARVRQ